MVVVKVRETYDIHTVKNKMTIISIHTPNPLIIQRNFPGLLMQCKAYRPLSADVALACASVLPLDPQGVGLAEGDVAPEDVFNPILYKAMSNKGMSQLEARINALQAGTTIVGKTALVSTTGTTDAADEFPMYYGLLSNAHDWKHAHPQQGLTMRSLKPLVYEMVYNVGDQSSSQYDGTGITYSAPDGDGDKSNQPVEKILGSAKPMPFINCTSYTKDSYKTDIGYEHPGFPSANTGYVDNCSLDVPWIRVVCGCIIVPPSRLHELFFRMTVVWNIEFSAIRPLAEITDFGGLGRLGEGTHYQNYSYESTKEAITGDSSTVLDNDACMISSNADIKKVM